LRKDVLKPIVSQVLFKIIVHIFTTRLFLGNLHGKSVLPRKTSARGEIVGISASQLAGMCFLVKNFLSNARNSDELLVAGGLVG
jgi:hypothetical protein